MTSRSKKAKPRRKSKKLKIYVQDAGSASTPVLDPASTVSFVTSSTMESSAAPVTIAASSVTSSTMESSAAPLISNTVSTPPPPPPPPISNTVSTPAPPAPPAAPPISNTVSTPRPPISNTVSTPAPPAAPAQPPLISSPVATPVTFTSSTINTPRQASAVLTTENDPKNGKFVLPSAKTDQTVRVNRSGRYIRIRPAISGNGIVEVCQVIVLNSMGVNLGLKANVYATSMDSASCIVDGVIKVRPTPVWKSKKGTDYIEIDLGSLEDIALVRVLGPSQKNMNQVRVEVNSDTTSDAIAGYEAAQAAIDAEASNAIAVAASAAVASGTQASTAIASAAEAQGFSIATASAATASGAIASAAQAFAEKENIQIGNQPKRGRFILPTNDADQTIYTNGFEGRYIRLRPSVLQGDGWINVSQIIVNDVTITNIAEGKPVRVSSIYPQTQNGNITVDGTTTVRNFPTLWQSSTDNRNDEFIEIDLEDLYYISSIQVLGRGNCRGLQPCIDRMKHLRIEIHRRMQPDAIHIPTAGLGPGRFILQPG